jgi:Beta propeller domain
VSEREVALSVPLLVRPNGVASRFNLNSPSSGLVRFRNKTVVMRSNAATFNTFISPPPPDSWISGRTVVEIVFDNAAEALQTYQLEGYLLSARRVGNRLYLLSRSSVFPAAGQYTDVSEYTARLQALPIADFLPAQWINGVKTPALDAARVFLPPSGAAPSRPEFSMITEIDLSKNMTDPGAIVTTAVLGQVSATFVSEKSLYLATNRYFPGRLITDFVPDFQATDVHRFSLTPTGVNYEASGSVLGNIEGSAEQVGLRFSEKGNDIRIVTTSSESNVINRVSVLAPSTSAPDLLSTVSILPSEQSPASIGKPGERITTSRFIGDRLYVSTFLRTDPLYVIDMANSANPKILSALEVPGFSDYLYPLSSRYLLGFGYNATSNGVRLGIELNVFDVGDPQRISRVINMPLGDNSSRSALSLNPLAFSYLPIDANSSRFGLPVVSSQSSGWMDFNFDDRGPNLRSQLKVDTTSSPTGGSAAGSTARGLYLRGLIVYLENGNIWYTLPDGTARKL